MNFDPDTAKAHCILARVACRRVPFTSDDLRDVIDQERTELKIQAIGKALAEAKTAGYIVRIGEEPSRRPENHSRRIDRWVLASDVTGKPVGNGAHSTDTNGGSAPAVLASGPEQTELPTVPGADGE